MCPFGFAGASIVDYGNLDARIELRNRLKCNSFGWFLKNIFPESNFEHLHFAGVIRNGDECLDYYGGARARTSHCHSQGGPQAFIQNPRKHIEFSGGECLCEKTDDKKEKFIGFCPCAGDDRNIKWDFNKSVKG